MDAVGADQEVAAVGRAVRQPDRDLVVLVLEVAHRRAEMQRHVGAARAQQRQQLAAHQAARIAERIEHPAELVGMDLLAVAVAHRVGRHVFAGGLETLDQVEPVEDPRTDRIETQHVAAMVEARRPLVEFCGHAPLAQQGGEGHAADAGAGNDDLHGLCLQLGLAFISRSIQPSQIVAKIGRPTMATSRLISISRAHPVRNATADRRPAAI